MNASSYDPPKVLAFVRDCLYYPRKDYNTDFASFVTSTDSAEHASYKTGLIFLASILGGVLFVWLFALAVLKYRGKSVGCAAGRAFRPDERIPHDKNDMAETDADDSASSEPQIVGMGNANGPSFLSARSHVSSFDGESYDSEDDYAEKLIPSRRENRTRIAFFVFGLLSLLLAPMALIFCFAPIRESATNSVHYIGSSDEIISEVESALQTINDTVTSAGDVIRSLPMQFELVCPKINASDFQATFGIAVTPIFGLIEEYYANITSQVSQNLSSVRDVLSYMDEVLAVVQDAYGATEQYIWFIPGLLIALCILVVGAMFGAVLAWKRESNRRCQRVLSYAALPLLMTLSLTSWVAAIGAALATAVGTDACMPGSRSGKPYQTIQSILVANTTEMPSSALKFVAAYTNGCQSEDPSISVVHLENSVQAVIDEIWQFLSAVDSYGRSSVEETCGPNNAVGSFLGGIRQLGALLTAIRRALDGAASTMKCDRIYPIYQEAVDESICTTVVGASAWGFLIFFGIGVTTLSMISLRASVRHKIGEDKVYDESEIAENMIVDEHEEYLMYISKYKHEWEEYHGIGSRLVNAHRTHSQSRRSRPRTSPKTTKRPKMTEVSSIALETKPDQAQEPFDPYGSDTKSFSTGFPDDISFQSLSNIRISPSYSNAEILATSETVLPPLLPRCTFWDDDDAVSPNQSDVIAEESTGFEVVNNTIPENYGADAADDNAGKLVSLEEKYHQNGSITDSSKKSRYAMVPSPARDRQFRKQHEWMQGLEFSSAKVSTFESDGQVDVEQPGFCPAVTARGERKFNAQEIMEGLEEFTGGMDSYHNTVGKPMNLHPPPKVPIRRISQADRNTVKFQNVDVSDASFVKKQVDRFSKSSISRPSTPIVKSPAKMKDLAARFEAHSQRHDSIRDLPSE